MRGTVVTSAEAAADIVRDALMTEMMMMMVMIATPEADAIHDVMMEMSKESAITAADAIHVATMVTRRTTTATRGAEGTAVEATAAAVVAEDVHREAADTMIAMKMRVAVHDAAAGARVHHDTDIVGGGPAQWRALMTMAMETTEGLARTESAPRGASLTRRRRAWP